MKTSLQPRLSQQLSLTPQLQQSIKLLQMSTEELQQELQQRVQENPLLEWVGDASDYAAIGSSAPEYKGDPSINGEQTQTFDANEGSFPSDDEYSSPDRSDLVYASSSDRADRDSDDSDSHDGGSAPFAPVQQSLFEHLERQLSLRALTDRDRQIVMMLLAYIDDNGYLETAIEELYSEISVHVELDPEELYIALRHIQSLDPCGVGARSLSECLLLQLNALPAETPHRANALRLVTHCLDDLARRDFGKLKKVLGLDEAALRGTRNLILTLDPRPGQRFKVSDTHFVAPEVVVRRVGKGGWRAFLNQETLPRLRVNRLYAGLLKQSRDEGGKNLQGQLQEARWLIRSVQQRFDTLLRVSQAIVDRQQNFFEHGEVAMRPLILRDIAEQVEMHESTVSRVTTQKYMMTCRGLFELKYFFGASIANDLGGSCSSTAIRALIKQMVAEENDRKPLSDNLIASALGQQGIVVARRTVAKYRESLNIPPANQRRAL